MIYEEVYDIIKGKECHYIKFDYRNITTNSNEELRVSVKGKNLGDHLKIYYETGSLELTEQISNYFVENKIIITDELELTNDQVILFKLRFGS